MILRLFLFISFFTFSNVVSAEYINIGILNSKKITEFTFSVRAGKYALFSSKGKVKEFNSGESIIIKRSSTSISVYQNGSLLGNFSKINLMGLGWYNHFMIGSEQLDNLDRRYDDNLKVSFNSAQLTLINNIDLDNYVAGVVEAEVGRKPPKEYFKLQAIICRTYALSNTHKHLYEGYNLCDEVHCQAYHGKTFFSNIVDAAMQTRGAVIVDSDIQLITAAFHSNCGGQTVNSEDVWTKSLYYLRSIEDTFCLNKRNSTWEKEIDIGMWNNYIASATASLPKDSIKGAYYSPVRSKYLLNSNLAFEDLRNKFKLRSTFFNFYEDNSSVKLMGRGYGHGVGLCQEGAMEMAARGYTYSEILHYYYSGVHIIDLAALDFFKED